MGVNRVAVTLITLVIIQIAFFTAVIREEKHQHLRGAMTTASKMALVTSSSTKDFFSRYLSIFDTLKSIDHITRQEQAPSSKILTILNDKYPEVVNFGAVKQNGDFFASGRPLPKDNVPNVKHLEFFQQILSGKKMVMMQPHIGPISKELVTGVIVPLEDEEGQINGALGVSIQFHALIKRWENIFPDSKIMMVVHNGKGINHFISSGLEIVGNDFLNTTISRHLKKIQLDKMTYVLHTITEPDTGWNFSIFVPAHSSFLQLVTSRKDLIFLFTLMIMTIGILGLWFLQERQWTVKLKREQKKLQESEAKFRQLAENINAVFWISLPDKSSMIYVSPGFEKIWGVTCQTLYDNPWYWAKVIHSEDRARIQASAIDKQHKGTYDEIYRIVRDDGEIRWIHDQAFPLSDTNGQIYRIVGIAEDITERKRLEKQLRQAQKMESIGTLAGGIAHDFNNILFPIVGHTEMLMEDIPKDSPLREGLDEIYISALRAKDLVKQILTFSRQENTDLKLMKIQSSIKETIKLIRSIIPTTIYIKEDIQVDCGVIKADPTQIHQITMNLATNAYHAMEKIGGELKVSLKEVKLSEQEVITSDMKPGDYACLTIADTGMGMDKELTEKIFDPFFTTKETGKGTGMGLSVVHGIVQSMDGAIQVYSEPGKGTAFHIYLPVIKASSEKQDTKTREAILVGTERILLVDDEKHIITMEKQMLERLGYQVTSQSSSIEALNTFNAAPDKFDLVITDMAMPNMSGDKLSVELVKIRSDIPILLCTGFSEAISETKVASMGIKGFLMKPIVMKDLALKIREVLDNDNV